MIQEKDNYSKIARTYPAVISLVVFLVMILIIACNNIESILLLYQKYGSLLIKISENPLFLKFAKIVPITVVFVSILHALFLLQKLFIRDVSKFFPEKLINTIWGIPTTRLLCVENRTYSEEQIKLIFAKLQNRHQIDLSGFENKSLSNFDYVREVENAISLIREDTRDNYILFCNNRIYGFWRNLCGGFLLNLILLLILKICDLFCSSCTIYTFSQFFIVFVFLALFIVVSFALTFKNGLVYAKQLYTAFLSE